LSIITRSPDAINEPAFLLASALPPSAAFERELASEVATAPSASSSSLPDPSSSSSPAELSIASATGAAVDEAA